MADDQEFPRVPTPAVQQIRQWALPLFGLMEEQVCQQAGDSVGMSTMLDLHLFAAARIILCAKVADPKVAILRSLDIAWENALTAEAAGKQESGNG